MKKRITLTDAKKLVEGISSRTINKSKDGKMYDNIAYDANAISKLNPTKNRARLMAILNQLEEIFIGSKANDETNDETKNTTDDKQSDTIERKESGEQRRNQEGQGLKILTPDQMLSRLTIPLAKSKVGNNSEKLKNEIR